MKSKIRFVSRLFLMPSLHATARSLRVLPGLAPAAAALAVVQPAAHAATITAVADGDWNTPNTWDTLRVPTSNDARRPGPVLGPRFRRGCHALFLVTAQVIMMYGKKELRIRARASQQRSFAYLRRVAKGAKTETELFCKASEGRVRNGGDRRLHGM